MSRRLPAARRRRLREATTARRTRTPSCSRDVRLRPARAEPRARSRRRVRRVAGLLRDDDRARAPAARARRAPRGASSTCTGITGSSGSGIAPSAGTHHPSPRRATSAPTSRSSTSTSRRSSQTLARRGRARPRAPLRAGLGAADARHLRHRASSSSPEASTQDAARARSSTSATRASRSCASRRSACPRSPRSPGSNYAEVGFAVGPGRAPGKRTVTLLRRDRQPRSRAAPARPSRT